MYLIEFNKRQSSMKKKNYLFKSLSIASLYLALPLHAQPNQISQDDSLIASAGLTGINQFQTNMNRGGSFSMVDGAAYLNLLKPVSQQTLVGLTIRYDYQNWSWKNLESYGLDGRSPWKSIDSSALGINFTHRITPEWQASIVPTIEYSGESGAKFSDSLTYGAILSASKRFSPDLRLGFGTGVFRQIDATKVFPYILVDWKITDRLNLNNPLPAGPAGGAGLELTYSVTPQFKLSAGGTYRSYRFRLNTNGPYADGVGQNTVFPLFARFTYAFDRSTALDLYGIVGVGGKISATGSSTGQEFNTAYKNAPAIALSFTKRF